MVTDERGQGGNAVKLISHTPCACMDATRDFQLIKLPSSRIYEQEGDWMGLRSVKSVLWRSDWWVSGWMDRWMIMDGHYAFKRYLDKEELGYVEV